MRARKRLSFIITSYKRRPLSKRPRNITLVHSLIFWWRAEYKDDGDGGIGQLRGGDNGGGASGGGA